MPSNTVFNIGWAMSVQDKVSKVVGRIKRNLKGAGQQVVKFRNSLGSTQEILRKELIAAVNEVISDIWEQLYPYDSYHDLRLLANEQDYALEFKDADDWIPIIGFASGGERMLACLAMRIAFSKVLAPNLNLLILDEPTHNLDENAINTFIDVVNNNVSKFIDQIFIITHDEKLAESSSNIIKI